MTRPLTKIEMSANYQASTSIIFDKLRRTCERELLPLRKISSDLTEMEIAQHMDSAIISLLANFILYAVTPLARPTFLENLKIAVSILEAQNTKQTPDGKIIVN